MKLAVKGITPKIVVDGQEYAPQGWEWVLGYALHDCDWAMKLVIRPSFRAKALEAKPEEAEFLNGTIDQIVERARERGIVLDQWDRLLDTDL